MLYLTGIADPEPCPAGSYTEEEGATGLEFCKDCPAGHYCEAGVDTPTPCEAGTMNPMVGQTDVSACQPCTAAFACTRSGLARPDYPCSPGFYCPGGNSKPNQTEWACPPGKFNDFNNLTAIDQCMPCPETTACLIATGGNNL